MGREGAGVREAMLRHDGKSNPLSGGRQGERLTDERDRRNTEGERGAPKGLADQRGTPSKNNDNEKGGGGRNGER